jgi:hypothetical protein
LNPTTREPTPGPGGRGGRLDRYVRAAEIEVAVLLVAAAVINLVVAARGPLSEFVGWDFGHYVDAARRWIETGTPYLAHEVAGPFRFGDQTFLHPPISLLLFAPFVVLPGVLFWLIPLLGTLAIIVGWRPALWAWPVIALQLNWPRFGGAVIVGNTDLWIVFFIAAGLRFGWPVLLLAIKPSIAPFAIIEVAALLRADAIPIRRWQVIGLMAGLLVALAVPFGGLWLDWLAIVRNSPADPLYSIAAIPWLSIPVVAWIARRRFRRRSDTGGRAPARPEDRRRSREHERDRGERRAEDEPEVRVGGDQEGRGERDLAADLEHGRDEEDETEDVE